MRIHTGKTASCTKCYNLVERYAGLRIYGENIFLFFANGLPGERCTDNTVSTANLLTSLRPIGELFAQRYK